MYLPQPDFFQRLTVNRIHVSDNQRLFSLAGGVALMSIMLQRRSAARIPAFVMGLGLVYRGVTDGNSAHTIPEENLAVVTDKEHSGFHVTQAATINRPVKE